MEKNKQVKLDVSLKGFFRNYLEVLKPLHNITPREADVLSRILYYNFIYSNYEEKVRSKVIFDYDTKAQIREELNMTVHQFLNILKSLRKKGVLKGETINENYKVYPDNPFSVTFQFNITHDV
jgi:DNA-binding MarR family transcriptional regulator